MRKKKERECGERGYLEIDMVIWEAKREGEEMSLGSIGQDSISLKFLFFFFCEDTSINSS